MKCKYCDGDGVIVDVEYGHAGKYICGNCDGTGVVEPMTNEEWFCSLPTDEKAQWLENKMTWAAQEQGTFTAKGWEMWLKQPHTKE